MVKNNNISISLSAIDYWADGFDEGRFSTSLYLTVFMYHRRILCTFHIAVDFELILCLRVPKPEIFLTELFILSDPIEISDLRTEPKNQFM